MVSLSLFPRHGKRWRNVSTDTRKPTKETREAHRINSDQDNNGIKNTQTLQRQQSSSSRASAQARLQQQYQREEVDLLYKLRQLERQAKRSQSHGGLSLSSLFLGEGAAGFDEEGIDNHDNGYQGTEEEDNILFFGAEQGKRGDNINIDDESGRIANTATTHQCCKHNAADLSKCDENRCIQSRQQPATARPHATSILASTLLLTSSCWGDENCGEDDYNSHPCSHNPPVGELTIPAVMEDDDISSLASQPDSLTTFGSGTFAKTELASFLPTLGTSSPANPSPTMSTCQCFGDMEAWVPRYGDKNNTVHPWQQHCNEEVEQDLQQDKVAVLQSCPTTIARPKKQRMYAPVMADKLSSSHPLFVTVDGIAKNADNRSETTADTFPTTSDSSNGDS